MFYFSSLTCTIQLIVARIMITIIITWNRDSYIWPLWQSWLRHWTNDQKILGSNPVWICHSGCLRQVHFHCPFIPKKYKMVQIWYKYGTVRAVMALSVDQFCAPLSSSQGGCSLGSWDGIRNEQAQWSGVIYAVDRAILLDVDYNLALLAPLYVFGNSSTCSYILMRNLWNM